MMLECLERPEQSVADAALEYISCLDYVAMTERHPQLQVRRMQMLLSVAHVSLHRARTAAIVLAWHAGYDLHAQQHTFGLETCGSCVLGSWGCHR